MVNKINIEIDLDNDFDGIQLELAIAESKGLAREILINIHKKWVKSIGHPEWTEKNLLYESNKQVFVSKNKKTQSSSVSDRLKDYRYIIGLPDQVVDFFFEYINKYNTNLYHSVAAVFNQKGKKSLEECFNLYFEKYKHKRPFILEKPNELKEFIKFVGDKLDFII